MFSRRQRRVQKSTSATRTRRLQLETLERRDTPAVTLAEVEPNGSFAEYQPLNNDAVYTVNGSLSALSDVDYYAFYAKEGSTVSIRVVAAQLTGNEHTEFDPTIGLFNPQGALVETDDDDGAGGGSFWASRITFTAPESGVWRLAVSHYNDTVFDGSNDRPSYDPDIPDSGPGVHTGPYVARLGGVTRPQVVRKDSEERTILFATPNAPTMPDVTLEVQGVVPEPGNAPDVQWQTRVNYRAADFPAQAGQYGRGRDLASPTYDDETIQDSFEYEPAFEVGGREVLAGGRLEMTAQITVGGQQIVARTSTLASARIHILGDNPTNQAIHNYISRRAAPGNWPTDSGHDYHTVLRQIISQESGIQQFAGNGVPLWSQDNLRGVGLFQITNPAPTAEQTWDWRRNVDAGIALFREKIAIARNRLNALFNRVRQEALTLNAQAAPITGEMIALEAIRAFNGLNNGNGVMDEWRAARNAQGRLVIRNGQTVWQRVPVALRGTTSGDPNYVNNVLGQADF